MLGFMIFLGWVVVFCLPLIVSVAQSIKKGEVSKKRWWFNGFWAVGGGILILLVGKILGIWTDILWFEELHYAPRFWIIFWAKWKFFLIGSLGSFILLGINIFFARLHLSEEEKPNLETSGWFRWTSPLFLGANLIISLIFGLVASGNWSQFLLYQSQVPFGISDPIFSKDVGFYVFSLPVLDFVATVIVIIALIALAEIGTIYLAFYSICSDRSTGWSRGEEDKRNFWKNLADRIHYNGFTHASIIGIFLMAVFIFKTKLDIWKILFSGRGAVFGAGWTDVHVQILAYWFFIVALGVAALFLLIAAIARSNKATKWMTISGFGICAGVFLMGVLIVPAIIQHVVVEPNELGKESEYIKHNIAFTQEAFGVSGKRVKQENFPVNTGEVNAKILEQDRSTLENIRLWDWRVLKATNSQNQAFRLYYTFPDVDVVYYRVNGRLRQLLVSSRELDQERLSEQSKTWQNLHLNYTHGFGCCANPVNVFTPEGLPDYWVKDIPPVAKFPELNIKEPRIYFGEKTLSHVYVRTKDAEFDYPEGDQNKSVFYQGSGGVTLSSWLRKFAFALRFDGIRLLTSSQITRESRILFQRDIASRVKTIAPFLTFDHDPYQVIADGQIWFMWDAYTTNRHYPYSEPFKSSKDSNGINLLKQFDGINYLRNSVKVTFNTFSGEVNFYVFDDQDPIIKTYQKIFPGLFKPASAMPEYLRQHIRYPEDLLQIQGEVYSVYHMEDPNVFYNKEDAWEIAEESLITTSQKVLPYYIIIKLPAEKEEEFIQMLPFTPLTTDEKNPRNNMVSWLAGRCSPEHYGELILYKFPKEKLVYGPLQIGIRMNQDENISKDFSLWNQQGSKAVPGNLLVIPLSDYRLLYVQPIYLEATVGKMPELKRVVLACGDRLVYESSFEEALNALLGGESFPRTAEATATTQPLQKTIAQGPVKEIAQHLEKYRQLTGQGKFAEAGREMEELSRLIDQALKEKGGK